MKLFTIDFQTKNREVDSRSVSKRYIYYEEEFFKFLMIPVFRKTVDIKIHRMWIELTHLPDSVKVNDLSKLITLSHADKILNEFNEFKIGNDRFNYEILFDPKQITDYDDFEKNTTEIKFRLNCQPTSKSQITSKELGFELKFHKAYPEPKLVVNIEDEFKNGFEHRMEKRVKLGSLVLESLSDVDYAFPLYCEVKIRFIAPYDTPVVYFGEKADIEEMKIENDVVSDKESGIKEPGDVAVSASEFQLDGLYQKLTVNKLPLRGKVEIPIFIDLDEIENPFDKDEHSFVVSADYQMDKHATFKSITEQFTILKDKRTTALLAVAALGDEEKRCADGDILIKSYAVRWNGPKEEGRSKCFGLRIGNQAENGEGLVYIDDFRLSFHLDDTTSSSTVVSKDGAGLNDIFLINDKNPETLPTQFRFPNAPGSYEDLSITLRHNKIQEMSGDMANFVCTVSFRYLVLENGLLEDDELKAAIEQSGHKMSFELAFEVEKDPGPYWLALDFGTSAIVAAFDDNTNDEPSLVDLQSPLSALVKDQDYKEDQIPEFATSFLSSTVALRNEGAWQARSYYSDAVLLSPTRNDLGEVATYGLVPYLKSLIGTRFLPNFNEAYSTFKFYDSEEDQKIGAKPWTYDEERIEFRQVLTNAYRILLRDFILRGVNDTDELNKVIVTIPNTFTPRHVEYIKALIEDEFHSFKQDYISFVSESDAVACYYLHNRRFLMKERSDEERQRLLTGTEYVLVYDMGAGTLDLTYLRIDGDQQGPKEVTVIGRLGKTTAGNFLDYVIATILYSLYESEFKWPMFGNVGDDPLARRKRLEFKSFVRNTVKPLLNDKEAEINMDSTYFVNTKDRTVKIKDITENKKLQDFVKQNTDDIFTNFFSLFNRIDGKSYAKGSFPLDTVVLSGRSVQFRELQEGIRLELNAWTNSDKVEYVDYLPEQSLKAVVVQGALEYAILFRQRGGSQVRLRNPNLQARYGILFRDPVKSEWKFKELLNPTTRPSSEKPHRHPNSGLTVYEYDTDKYDADPTNDGKKNYVDLSNTPAVYFVQSYSAQTAEDKEKNNLEYMSIMRKIYRNQIGQGDNLRAVRVCIQVNTNNEMTVTVGDFIDAPRTPLEVDLEESETFKHSMWPFLE